MKIEIKSRFTGAVLYAHDAEENSIRITLQAAISAGANLAGANLAGANLAGANLAGAYLAGAYLAGAYLADADLARAYLADANLAGAYLAGAYLADADLARAYLADANLAGAYLAGAKDVVPIVPNIDAAILAAIETGGTLDMGDWHTCETTHCRAGWAITLAGKAGAELEQERGPFIAGCLIYSASRPGKLPPHFFATNADAMADIRACAAAGEAA